MTAKVGVKAPNFHLASDSGRSVTLDDFRGKWLVLYFYPKDDTPGCTRQAHEFSAAMPRLRRLGAEIAGVSRDSVQRHCSFRDRVGVAFPLLADPDLEAHKAYGVWGIKTMYGKKVEGTIRSTFLISPRGETARVWSGVRVAGHVDAVIEALRSLQTQDEAKPVVQAKAAGKLART